MDSIPEYGIVLFVTLPILFQDDEVVVVNKSSGLLVHRSDIDRQAQEFAMQTVRDQIGKFVYPVHRLDRPTSGALVFALSSSAARSLSTQFINGIVQKTYLAVVRGTPPPEVTVNYALKEEADSKSARKARLDKPAQEAITEFKTLATHEFSVMVDKFPTSKYSLVRAKPKTGRKHQIRRHLRHLGCPIIGDVRYGSGKHNRFFKDRFQIQRLLLACVEIAFEHPKENKIIRVQAPLSEDFQNLTYQLGWGDQLG